MTEKTAPWWRSFVGKRRKAARESASVLEQELGAHAAATAEKTSESSQRRPTEPEPCRASSSKPQADGSASLLSNDRYDDSAVQSTFNESSNRRNLRVSRSGRFKEKRRERGALPQGYEGTETPETTRDTHSSH